MLSLSLCGWDQRCVDTGEGCGTFPKRWRKRGFPLAPYISLLMSSLPPEEVLVGVVDVPINLLTRSELSAVPSGM